METRTTMAGGEGGLSVMQTGPVQQQLKSRCIELLKHWDAHASETWTWLSPSDASSYSARRMRAPHPSVHVPSEPVAGYYGTGYASWGVMAQAATVGVYAALAMATEDTVYLERCLKGLRYLCGTHAAGPLRLTDGTKWGACVSSHDERYAALWVAQGMLAFDLIESRVDTYDRALVRSVLTTEADSYLALPVQGGLGPEASRAESNAWKAAILSWGALLYPENPRAQQWQQKSCLYWLNSISVDKDADDSRFVRGRPISDWHRVSNFHAHFGVTHRGFFHPSDISLTLGVMALCALMHVRRKQAPPVETFHHWNDALAVIVHLYLWDFTMACVGGQTWPRYSWDQAMLLPVFTWAGTHVARGPLPELPVVTPAEALTMADGLLQYLGNEQASNGDGSFYSKRLSAVREQTEWDYLRYEAGTAFALATAYAMLCTPAQSETRYHRPRSLTSPVILEGYKEPSLGTIWHRSANRFASWSWQACRIPAQGLVIPCSGRRMCEWNGNLVGTTRLKEHEPYHALQYHREHDFTGGFATLGLMAEQLPMWPMADKTPSLRHGIAFWALPDGDTCILLDLVWAERLVNVVQNRGLLYKLANDYTNGNRRILAYKEGRRELTGIGATPEVWTVPSPWLVIDDCLFIIPLWGGNLTVDIRGERMPARYGYGEATLLWQDVCVPLELKPGRFHAGELLRDTCTAYVCEVSGQEGNAMATRLQAQPLPISGTEILNPYARALRVCDRAGRDYVMAANFDREEISVAIPSGWNLTPITGNGRLSDGRIQLPPASLTLCACE